VTSRLMQVAGQLAGERGLNEQGYRLAWNHGPDTSQTIAHPHLHLLGGRPLQGLLA
jgi:histidine triad (HIT) family protein